MFFKMKCRTITTSNRRTDGRVSRGRDRCLPLASTRWTACIQGHRRPFDVSGQRAEETYEGGKSRICLFTEFLNYLNGYGEISERREEERQTARGMAGICMRDGRQEKE